MRAQKGWGVFATWASSNCCGYFLRKVINKMDVLPVLSMGREGNENGNFEEISSRENPTRTLE